MRNIIVAATLLFAAWLTPIAQADSRIQIAATTPNMGMLARTVGGDSVNVRVMAPGDRDIHHLEARPSMMVALRRSDLVVAVGAELEVGWLPAALRSANNPAVLPGQIGYFEAAGTVELLDAGRPADRALGDVHPMGNPHIYFDPARLAEAGEALAERLAQLDDAGGERFRANARRFSETVTERLDDWRRRTENVPGVVLYHEDAVNLMQRLGVDVWGYIEPIPGVPPTARHLRGLVERLENRDGGIFYLVYESPRGPQFLERQLGWPAFRLRSDVDVDGTMDDYLALIEEWVSALESI